MARFKRMVAVMAAVLLAGGLAACGGSEDGRTPGDVDFERVADIRPEEWLMNGRDFRGDRFSPLTEITPDNVGSLGLAWEFRDFLVRGRTHHGVQANPVVVDGVMYFAGPWGDVHALDARTGASRWSYDPEADGQSLSLACCGVLNRGIAVWRGKVYVATLDGHLAAVDAATGREVWKVDTIVDRGKWNASITGAPYVAGDNIVIGQSGGDMGIRGYASAYDAETGKLAWRFWTVPGDPKDGPDEHPEVTLARKTWAEDTHWELGVGGNPWDSMAYDPELNLVYIGTGNGNPHPQWLRSDTLGGDDLFLSSIIAVDADSGRMKWYYQTTPGDSWDYNAAQPMILADLEIGGSMRKVLMQAPKNGFFYVLDRATGELLKADPYTTVNWAERVDLETGRPVISARANYSNGPQIIWPSAIGGHAWQPMAYSPDAGLVYFQAYDVPMKKTRYDGEVEFRLGTTSAGFMASLPPFNAPEDAALLKGQPKPRFEARIKAWDPVKGEVVWQSEPLRAFMGGGTLATATGLVFHGSTDGTLTAYDARTGAVRARLQTGTPLMGAPISYMLDGEQYIAIMGGMGGPLGAAYEPAVIGTKYQNFERLLVLKLNGAKIPLPPEVQMPALVPMPERIPAAARDIARGEELFTTYCIRCHNVGGAFGNYPNLWNMSEQTRDSFESIVHDGAFSYSGMASFAQQLSRADVAAIKAYIVNDTIARRRAGQPIPGTVAHAATPARPAATSAVRPAGSTF